MRRLNKYGMDWTDFKLIQFWAEAIDLNRRCHQWKMNSISCTHHIARATVQITCTTKVKLWKNWKAAKHPASFKTQWKFFTCGISFKTLWLKTEIFLQKEPSCKKCAHHGFIWIFLSQQYPTKTFGNILAKMSRYMKYI